MADISYRLSNSTKQQIDRKIQFCYKIFAYLNSRVESGQRKGKTERIDQNIISYHDMITNGLNNDN